MKVPKKVIDQPSRRGAPARTLEGREKQLIGLAVDLAEKQLSEGTASAQVITHYLKLGSTTEILARQKLEEENKLLRAKTEQLGSLKKTEELYREALNAMRSYTGQQDQGDADDNNAEN